MITPRRGGTPRTYSNTGSSAIGPGRYADGSQVPDATHVVGDQQQAASNSYFQQGGRPVAPIVPNGGWSRPAAQQPQQNNQVAQNQPAPRPNIAPTPGQALVSSLTGQQTANATPAPNAAQPHGEVGTYVAPQPSITDRSLSMIPSATLDKLAQQKAVAKGQPTTMSSQYGTGSVAFAPHGSALADHGRVFNDGKDVTAQTMANVAQSGNPEPQAPAIRPSLDNNIQKALVKQYPNIGIAGHPEHQAFLDAYTKAYDPNKPMTADQVTALAGSLYPKPEVNIASNNPNNPLTGSKDNSPFATPIQQADPNVKPEGGFWNGVAMVVGDAANMVTGMDPSKSFIDNAANKIAGPGAGSNPGMAPFQFTPPPLTKATPNAPIGLGNGVTAAAPTPTAPMTVRNGASSIVVNNPSGNPSAAPQKAPQGALNTGGIAINNPDPFSPTKPNPNIVISQSPDWTGNTADGATAKPTAPTVNVGGMTLGGQPPAADGQSDDDKKKNKGGSVFGGSPIPVASAVVTNPLFP